MTSQTVNLLDRIAKVLPPVEKTVELNPINVSDLKQDLINFRDGAQPLSKNFLLRYTRMHDDEQMQAWVFSGSYTVRVLSELFSEESDYGGELEILHCVYVRDERRLVFPTFHKRLTISSENDKFEELNKALTKERDDVYKKYMQITDHKRFVVCSPRLMVTKDKALVIFTTYLQGSPGEMPVHGGHRFNVEQSDDAIIEYLDAWANISYWAAGLSTYRQIVGNKPFDEYVDFVINERAKVN